MAFLPVPNCAEVVLQGLIEGHDAFITLGFEQASEFSVGDLEGLLTVVEAWWGDELAPLVCDDWQMPSMKATSLQTDHSPVVIDTDFDVHAGLVTTTPVADAVAMSVTFQTVFRGRSFRGRNFVPALPVAGTASGSRWGDTLVADMTAAYQALETALNDTPYTHVVISRRNGGVERLLGLATPVINYQARTKMATQRRRVLGTGA